MSDTGAGIDPADLPRLFDPVLHHQARVGAVTGLGLSVCQGIVTSLGGTHPGGERTGPGQHLPRGLAGGARRRPPPRRQPGRSPARARAGDRRRAAGGPEPGAPARRPRRDRPHLGDGGPDPGQRRRALGRGPVRPDDAGDGRDGARAAPVGRGPRPRPPHRLPDRRCLHRSCRGSSWAAAGRIWRSQSRPPCCAPTWPNASRRCSRAESGRPTGPGMAVYDNVNRTALPSACALPGRTTSPLPRCCHGDGASAVRSTRLTLSYTARHGGDRRARRPASHGPAALPSTFGCLTHDVELASPPAT